MAKKRNPASPGNSVRRYLFSAVLLAGTAASGQAFAQIPNLSVVKPDGTAVEGYRWLIEEDRTHHIEPGQTCLNGDLAGCLSVDFHRSHMPVVAEGTSSDTLPNLDPNKRYFISVLPFSAGTEGGASLGGVPIAMGQTAVTVTVNELPIPTAQIRVFVFEDNYPINNAPDLPEEQGLDGFKVVLYDAGGRFGVAGGQVSQDAFGNPLGTTYKADGSVNALGDGNLYTGPDGYISVKNLAPAKYGVQVVPPAGGGWQQTSTIEGTKTVDAWVKANEPAYFAEFGPPGPHVFIGFVKQDNFAPMAGSATVRGRIMGIHNSRPPEFTFYTGAPLADCWVGLNDLSVGVGKGLYATPCSDDSTFTIPQVAPGNYQLAIWDTNLDAIFGMYNFTVGENATDVNLQDVPVFKWFAGLENHVFNDLNENGIWDENEGPIPEQNINIRWRDGTIYQAMPTDTEGASPFEEVFPFFSWLVAEVDYARFKATGVTVVVDDGGPVDPTQKWSFDGKLNPQPQTENGGELYRVETGPVLTQAFQGFLGQTSVIQWGKKAYEPGENGGISGMVFYATTRAEDNPQYAVAEEWEPGVPRIQVELYRDDDGDNSIDDVNNDGLVSLSDVDNYPFGWKDGGAMGPEDIDRDNGGAPGVFFAGDAIQLTTTDSWDDNLPEGCQGDTYMIDDTYPTDCYDGLRNFNQVRPGVFDGGYAFTSYVPEGVSSGNAEVDSLPSGNYIVATGAHPVYKTVAEADKNVDFGEIYVPQILPPACVGDQHEVPHYLSFQTDRNGVPLPGIVQADLIEAPYAGTERASCDRKLISVVDGRNAAVDFFIHTTTPIAGHVVGFILDDLSNEFDEAAPTFGEKHSPPFLPVSIRDWTGREISRTYSDRWGVYNALIPSTYTMNLPMPSGASPNMLVACMNSPGPIKTANGEYIADPHFNRQYSQFCYTFQYMPGATTYLDTPVVPVAAFAGPGQFPLDCEFPDQTPMVWSVSGSRGGLPVDGPYTELGGTLTITSAGTVPVSNPDFGRPGETKTISRDFGFGSSGGTVRIGDSVVAVESWTNDVITVRLPPRARISSGQLTVTRNDSGESSRTGVHVTIGTASTQVRTVYPDLSPGATPIQDAIDMAAPGELILVAPGVYEEMVIVWKPVRLQGSGASTVINAVNAPGEKLQGWYDRLESLVNAGHVDLLPSQKIGFALPEPTTLFTESGAGITVVAKNGTFLANPNARIDGFSITGSDNGGGIVVNGYADYLEISNNRVFGNHGVYGGGIRVGHPELVLEVGDGLVHQDSDNDNIRIHHNWVSQNGGNGGVGGGVSLAHGADGYQVTDNFICGNFTQGDGGGIGHLGVSHGGVIARNSIVFNQSFSQAMTVSGGGLYIAGAPGLDGPGSLSKGSGSVRVEGNLIQGNLAGAGDGGGIRMAFVNGDDVANRADPQDWYRVDVMDNIIVNNVAGYAGGGISLQDTVAANILHNTIVNNDSTATAGLAFPPGNLNESVRQPAGIVAYAHSNELAAAFIRHDAATRAAYGSFSNPQIANSIVRNNRSFLFHILPDAVPPQFGLSPDIGGGESPQYWDLAVVPAGTGALSVQDCGNPVPSFVQEYVNGDSGQTIQQPEQKTSIAAMPAFDEGGNFIDVRFWPLTLDGSDYHLAPGSAGLGGCPSFSTVYPSLADDIDGQARSGAAVDIGADEVQ